MSSRAVKIWLILLAIGIVSIVAYAFRPKAALVRTFASPDGRFEIALYCRPMPFAMPGQSSDAPGYFQLRDVQTGRVLRERDVEMIQLVDQVNWTATNVDVRLLADWSLPR